MPTDSFFDFFSPPQALIPDEDDNPDESDEWLRTMDFDIGKEFKDGLIPRAVYWFTGEASEDLEMDDLSDGDSDEEDSDDQMDSSEENDSDD